MAIAGVAVLLAGTGAAAGEPGLWWAAALTLPAALVMAALAHSRSPSRAATVLSFALLGTVGALAALGVLYFLASPFRYG